MSLTNIILIIVGAIVTLIGILTIFYPNFARIINAPGGARLKAIISMIIGLIILIIGLSVEFSG